MTPSWRAANQSEIRRFYRESFPEHIEAMPERITPPGPKQFGIAFEEPFPTVGDEVPSKAFVRRHSKRTTREGTPTDTLFESWRDLLEWVQAPADVDPLRGTTEQALADPMLVDADRPVPEAVYYTLQHWDRPWVVMLDIDAKDIAAERAEVDSVIEGRPPESYPYTFADIDQAIEYGLEAEELLQSTYGAERTQVYYTGQGVHVYLLDTDPAHRYDRQSREVLVELLHRRHGIPVDGVVTSDPARFGRLPYSLHAGVSRVVTPVKSTAFDPRTDACPPFLAERPGVTEVVGDA
jgi:hypothetical protein